MANRIRVAVLLAALSAPIAASAQIYQWTDESGARHFTNDPEEIPESERERAEVVVRKRRVEVAAAPAPAAQAAEAVIASEAAQVSLLAREARRLETERWRLRRERARRERERMEPRQAQVVYDRSLERAAPPVASTQPVVQDVQLNVSGPLAVSQVYVEQSNASAYDPYGYGAYGYDPYAYGPAISTAFDRGRYRHRTVRMWLQRHFQYDRDGPYFYQPPRQRHLPAFDVVLPRGVRRGRTCSNPTSRAPAKVSRSAAPAKLPAIAGLPVAAQPTKLR